MKNIIVSVCLILAFTIFSCSKGVGPLPEVSDLNTINFGDLKVGDKFQYSLFIGENYFQANNNNFEYTEDFLNVEIVEKLPNGFMVKEWIDESSNMFTSTENYYYQDEETIHYNNWIIENDKITIESKDEDYIISHLFLDGFINLSFSLDQFNGEEIEIASWKTDRGFSESNADFFVKDFDLLGNNYDRLNVVVRDEPMAADGNGNTYLYSEEAGFVRVVTYSAWTGKGLGWDRIK